MKGDGKLLVVVGEVELMGGTGREGGQPEEEKEKKEKFEEELTCFLEGVLMMSSIMNILFFFGVQGSSATRTDSEGVEKEDLRGMVSGREGDEILGVPDSKEGEEEEG